MQGSAEAGSSERAREAVSIDHEQPTAREPALVSVVMPVRNGTPTLELQLEALCAQTYHGAWELIVADNGSHDDSVEVASRFTGRLPLTIVDASARRGISAARNQGAAVARGELLLFCDADDIVDPDWMTAMVAAARDGDVVGGRLDPTHLNPPNIRDSRPSPQPPRGLATAQRHLPYATGASLGVWAETLRDLAGFEEAFRRCGDDVDFSWRAQLAGYRLVYAPAAVTRYRYRSGLGRMLAQSLHYGLADAMVFRRYRPDLPRPGLRRYARVIRDVPDLWRGPIRRRAWLWSASYRMGWLLGRVRPRTLRMAAVADLPRPEVATATHGQPVTTRTVRHGEARWDGGRSS